MSELEETLALHIKAFKLPVPEREYRFHVKRKWRFDFCWVDIKLAVECQGGLYSNGAHNRGAAMEKEYEKLGAAALLGWTVYQAGPNMIKNGTAIQTIRELIEIKKKQLESI